MLEEQRYQAEDIFMWEIIILNEYYALYIILIGPLKYTHIFINHGK